ncbi:MAG: winged helix-turn-helix transcriptional regulator [Magnetococcales bacterium]|nr:winged helix-turn-helix transcriptional regulator [Magnetococcales bacterium]
MNKDKRTPSGKALTDLVLELFRLNNRLLVAGDRLVANIGLTSARWKVLGTITASERPQPVAWLARDMGANRQNIQRIVNDLTNEGLVVLRSNPHHRRAPLVVLTDAGTRAFEQAMRLQAPWINELSDGLPVIDIETTLRVITAVSRKLEGDGKSE